MRRSRPDDQWTATVSDDTASQNGAAGVSFLVQQPWPPVVPARVVVRAFQRLESGGRELHLAWERARRPWSADASTAAADGATVVNVFYIAQDAGERAQFRYDPRTDIVTRQ